MSESRLQWRAELALGALMVATVLGFGRLFDGDDHILPLVTTAVLAHVAPAWCRRRGWGLPLTAVVSALGFTLVTTWLLYLDTSLVGLPTTATISEARTDLIDAWAVFQEVVAPAPVEPGFLVASCVAIWLAAYLADWAAFRLWSSFEAIVPSATLFVFASLVGSTHLRLFATVLYLVAALAFLLLHRIARQAPASGWLGTEAGDGSSVMLRSGAALCAGAVVIAVVVGPQLPGVDEEAIWEPGRRGADEGSRVTLSPMVDIRKRIVEQSSEEVFTVRSPVRAYWRLTSLDTFDGSIWKSRGDFEEAEGELPVAVDSAAPRVEATQQIAIRSLSALWLPAAFQPVAIDREGADVVYEPDSSTLIVGSDLVTSDGLHYEVESSIPRFDREALLRAPTSVPGPIADRYLALPDRFSTLARDTAVEVTAGLSHPYEKALALQDFFRTNFEYSVDVEQGHGVDAVDDFLTTRIGYCEQFAGTYAAMARSVGLPARVAVGFTPGEVDPNDPELYHVRGEHAHAWPEVYIEEYGWVPFEPTVSRGIPDAEQYTNVTEPPEVESTGPDGTTPTSTTVPGGTVPSSSIDLDPGDLAGATATTGEAPPDDPEPGLLRPLTVLVVLLLVGAAAATYAGGVLALKRQRRRRRRRLATDPRTRVDAAWADTLEALAVAGIHPRPEQTPNEFVAGVPPGWGLEGRLLVDLAEAEAASRYARQGPSPAQAERAEQARSAVEAVLPTVTTRSQRIRAALDPRPLLPRRHPRLVTDRTSVRPQSL